jgi:hypothetical protein
VNHDYLTATSYELDAVGIRGRLRSRILIELEDHLRCDPEAELGSPRGLAHQFADELGTSRARRGVTATFAALALAGILFSIAFIAALGFGVLRTAQAQSRPVALIGAGLAVLLSQVAFATGTLAALRMFWRRHDLVLTREEATVLVRRIAIAIASGIGAMVGLALLALDVRHKGAGSGWGWRNYALVASALGTAALVAVSPTALAAARVRPMADGDAGDVFDDLGPLAPRWLRGRPWQFALIVAGALALVIWVDGVAVADPYDGFLRGIAEALACVTGFGVLGRYIGLTAA